MISWRPGLISRFPTIPTPTCRAAIFLCRSDIEAERAIAKANPPSPGGRGKTLNPELRVSSSNCDRRIPPAPPGRGKTVPMEDGFCVALPGISTLAYPACCDTFDTSH